MSELDHRFQCTCCARKRRLKFLYLLWIPYTHHYIRVCVDCFAKWGTQMRIEESAAAAPQKVT